VKQGARRGWDELRLGGRKPDGWRLGGWRLALAGVMLAGLAAGSGWGGGPYRTGSGQNSGGGYSPGGGPKTAGSSTTSGDPLASGGIGGCQVFPANNVWNTPIDQLPVDPHSDDYIQAIEASHGLHPDFGAGTWQGAAIGIPYNVVDNSTAGVRVSFTYSDESDDVLYPIPANPLIEGGSDRHLLMVNQEECWLFELYDARLGSDGWMAGSGAFFNLRSNGLRQDGWTSADAAGLAMLPGLARYEEAATGTISHALRFTLQHTRNEHIWPARHDASSSSNSAYPPMGQRFRLKANYQIPENFSAQSKAILQALKTYGMILADNGSDWYVSGAPDPGWEDERLVSELGQVTGAALEAVDERSLMSDPNSGAAGSRPGWPGRAWLPVVR
jgi:hypothetical protein